MAVPKACSRNVFRPKAEHRIGLLLLIRRAVTLLTC